MAAPVLKGRRLRCLALAGALALALAGCESVGSVSTADTDMERVGVLLLHAITGIGSSESVPRERAAAIPYASLGVRLGSSDESMFVLGGRTGHDLLWMGGAKLALTTRQGRIVSTVGFEHNLSGFQAMPEQTAASPAVGYRSYLYDFAEHSQYGIIVKCTQKDLGREQIVILGVAHDTAHLAENCAAPELDWSFRNEFWSDRTGFVWRSRQYVQPDLDALTLEVLRPAQ
jgi:Group 4 capsule polysaccharide lipoprotein gfcB, YjbF